MCAAKESLISSLLLETLRTDAGALADAGFWTKKAVNKANKAQLMPKVLIRFLFLTLNSFPVAVLAGYSRGGLSAACNVLRSGFDHIT